MYNFTVFRNDITLFISVFWNSSFILFAQLYSSIWKKPMIRHRNTEYILHGSSCGPGFHALRIRQTEREEFSTKKRPVNIVNFFVCRGILFV